MNVITAPSITDFDTALARRIDRATKQHQPHIEVNAGDLHREVGGYPGGSHRMPMCCQSMRKVYDTSRGDVIISEPPSGQGASLTIRYMPPK